MIGDIYVVGAVGLIVIASICISLLFLRILTQLKEVEENAPRRAYNLNTFFMTVGMLGAVFFSAFAGMYFTTVMTALNVVGLVIFISVINQRRA